MTSRGKLDVTMRAAAVIACVLIGAGCGDDNDNPPADAAVDAPKDGPADTRIDTATPDTASPDTASPDGPGPDAAVPDGAGGDASSDTVTAAHWEYEGNEGPSHWGDLPGYATCGTGTQQSPVDIKKWMQFSPLAGMTYAYAAAPGTIKDNGHTVQVDFTGGTNKVTLGGKDYSLLQFHFHAHSEHTIAGATFPLELHMVHRAADGELAVVGILYKTGAENAALDGVFDQMGAASSTPVALSANLDPTTLLPADRNGWTYAGSLTTPPCSEGVRWHVYSSVLDVSAAQLAAFTTRHAISFRPVQNLNTRTITSGNGTFTAAHWEYAEEDDWGTLGSGEYSRCGTGAEQSPINIPDTVAADALDGVMTSYSAAPASIVDNGHTVQVNFTGGTNKITLGGKDFNLLQFHFHAQSEHTIDGNQAPLEMHLVHKAADGELAVLGVMFEEGDDASVPLAPVFAAMDTADETATALAGNIDPSALLPADKDGWSYSGSLTTPPCSEGVRWHVYANPLPVSAAQLAEFSHEGSFREVQDLNTRTISSGN